VNFIATNLEQKEIERPIKGDGIGANKAYCKVQAILKAILLRRTKQSEIDGKPIITLPPRYDQVDYAKFDEDQKAFYDALESKVRQKFNKYIVAGNLKLRPHVMLTALLRLRQACCHPHLLKDFREDDVAGMTGAELLENAEKAFSKEVIQRIVNAVSKGVPYCESCKSIPVARLVAPCGHGFCTECHVSMQADDDESDNDCLICKSPIKHDKVTDLKSFKKVHMHKCDSANSDDDWDLAADNDEMKDFIVKDDDDEKLEESYGSEDERTNNESPHEVTDAVDINEDSQDSEDEDITLKPDRFSKISKLTVSDDGASQTSKRQRRHSFSPGFDSDSQTSKKIKTNVLSFDGTEEPDSFDFLDSSNRYSSTTSFSSEAKTPQTINIKKETVEAKNAIKTKRKKLAELQKEASRCSNKKSKYMSLLARQYVPSAKIEKCLEIIKTTPIEEKIIIFSEWTTMLDILEVPILQRKIRYNRYGGHMTANQRTFALDEFKNDPKIKIMLVSLRAGNAGLNLVSANHVILFDPFWNPYVEDQAIDRCHRIGQKKPVHVHRIIVKDTVEDRILTIQEKKRDQIESALDPKSAKFSTGLDSQDYAWLFGIKN
jgi:SNF2 family DNA or RNA helicase